VSVDGGEDQGLSDGERRPNEHADLRGYERVLVSEMAPADLRCVRTAEELSDPSGRLRATRRRPEGRGIDGGRSRRALQVHLVSEVKADTAPLVRCGMKGRPERAGDRDLTRSGTSEAA
jgi:hypothetical protein